MQNRKLKVMHILQDLGVGGTQEVVRTLVEYLAMGDCVPIVCTLKDGHLRQDIEKLGVKVEFLEGRRYDFIYLPLFVLDLLRIRQSLADLIRRYDIEVVQTHTVRFIDLLLLTLLPTTSLRVVLWTFHSANYLSSRAASVRYVYDLLYRLHCRKVDGFVAVSDEVRKAMLRRIGPIQEKIVTIYNGVDLKRYERSVDRVAVRRQLGLGAEAQVVATVGTLRKAKGHAFLIDAVAMVVPQYPNLHFLFIGDGELKTELQAQVQSLNLSGNIHFLGNRSDVATLLAASDFFVSSSLWEGLPMSLLEAMAASKPIVATAVSGTKLVMIPNETGLVVPPGDAQKLAEAIIQLVSDPARAKAMGVAARQRVAKEFSAQKQANDHLALYRRLLNEAAALN
jgi:glycosyltransferase involved in cell wall biosynthesis